MFHPPAWAQDLLLALFVVVMQVQGTVTRTQGDPASVVRPVADLGQLGYVLDKRPARAALRAIEQTGLQALHEMRAVLGVLRDAEEGRVPHPGLGQIDGLAATARDAGLHCVVGYALTPPRATFGHGRARAGDARHARGGYPERGVF